MVPKYLLITGVSGAGKTTLINKIKSFDERFNSVAQITTRGIRPGENDKTSITLKEFNGMRDLGMFFISNEFCGLMTATLMSSIIEAFNNGKFPISDFPIKEVPYARSILKDRICCTYILPPSLEVLKQRLNGRDATGERFNRALAELKDFHDGIFDNEIDYRAINDDLEGVALSIYSNFLMNCYGNSSPLKICKK